LCSRRIDRTDGTASLRRLLASFFDVRDTNPEQAGYVTHRSPLIDEVVILKRPLSRLPCFVFNALYPRTPQSGPRTDRCGKLQHCPRLHGGPAPQARQRPSRPSASASRASSAMLSTSNATWNKPSVP